MPPRGPFVPTPLTCQIVVRGRETTENRPIRFVMHARTTATPPPSEIDNIADQFVGWINHEIGNLPSNTVWDDVLATDLNSATGPQIEVPIGATGTDGAGVPGLCVVLEQFTAKRGKSYTGRTYWPVAEDNIVVASGSPSSAMVTNMGLSWTYLETSLAALTPATSVVVASRKLHTSEVVTSMVVRGQIARIRRRQLG